MKTFSSKNSREVRLITNFDCIGKSGGIDFWVTTLLLRLKVGVLPVTSAAISPSALMTFTCTTPTSFRFWKDLHTLWNVTEWEGGGEGVKRGVN